MQQNVTAVGALSLAPLGSSPGHLDGLRMKGKGTGGRDRKGVEQKGRLTLINSWNRAADWLGRP